MELLTSKELLVPINLGKLDSNESEHLAQALGLKNYKIRSQTTIPDAYCPGVEEDQFLHFSPVEKREGLTIIGVCLRQRVDGYSVHHLCSHASEHGKEIYFHQGNYCSSIAEAMFFYCDRLKKSKNYLTPQDFEVKFQVEASTSVTAMSEDHVRSIITGNVNIAIEHNQSSGYAYVDDATIEFITIARREDENET